MCSVTQQVAPLRNELYSHATIKIHRLFIVYGNHFTFTFPKNHTNTGFPPRVSPYRNNQFLLATLLLYQKLPHNIISKIRTSLTDKGKPSEMAGRKATDPHLDCRDGWLRCRSKEPIDLVYFQTISSSWRFGFFYVSLLLRAQQQRKWAWLCSNR